MKINHRDIPKVRLLLLGAFGNTWVRKCKGDHDRDLQSHMSNMNAKLRFIHVKGVLSFYKGYNTIYYLINRSI